MATHQKAMNTQIAQIAQQVSYLSWPQGYLLGQPETNPTGYINTISALGEGLEQSLVVVLQEPITVPDSVGTKGRKNEESLTSNERSSLHPQLCAPISHLYLTLKG